MNQRDHVSWYSAENHIILLKAWYQAGNSRTNFRTPKASVKTNYVSLVNTNILANLIITELIQITTLLCSMVTDGHGKVFCRAGYGTAIAVPVIVRLT